MILDNLFASQKTYDAEIQTISQTNTYGVLCPKVWITIKTVECLFWRGGLAQKLISGKLAPDVSAVVIVRQNDISTSEIPAGCRIYIKEKYNMYITPTPIVGYFSVIYADNIAGQDQVIMIPVKEVV